MLLQEIYPLWGYASIPSGVMRSRPFDRILEKPIAQAAAIGVLRAVLIPATREERRKDALWRDESVEGAF